MTTPLTTLGPYRIDREIGRGGMGVVYLGYDTRLDRPVAIKALPDHLADDPDRLARLAREARTLAALSHPNIAAIYGLEEAAGQRYLVLEYADGETLDARLARGALPVEEALPIARQIAEALDAAHETGVIHRDLKPANIKIRDDGTVKVLDFGLAKAVDQASGLGHQASERALADSPTFTSPATQAGVILGTAAYMSPEQARGKPVDKRADIWAFGVVLYEMLTGDRPFAGETASDVIAAVLQKDVDFTRLPRGTPARVSHLLRRCLERDRAARYRDIGDVLIELRPDGPDQVTAGAPGRGAGLRAAWMAGAAFAAGAALVAAIVWLVPGERPLEHAGPKRFSVGGFGMPVDAFLGIALSPDGTHLAVRGLDETGSPQIYLRALDSLEVVPVEGSRSGWFPFFSPDGRHLAFYAMGQIKIAPVQGGAARTVSAAPGGFTGGVWTGDALVFTGTDSVVYRVPSSGGSAEQVDIDRGQDIDIVVASSALPGGDAILCAVRRGGRFDIAIASLGDGSLRVIEENGFQPEYSASGHILYQQGQQGPLMALPFDVRRLQPTARAYPVVANIAPRVSFQTRAYAVAADGTLAFVQPIVTQDTGTLVWVDSSGRREVIATIDRTADMPRLSHDGHRLAFRTPAPNCDIWVHDLVRGATTRLTSEGDNHGIVWSGDDERIATLRRGFARGRPLWLRSDGAGAGETLYPDDLDHTFLSDVSRDGRQVLVSAQREGSGWDVSLIDAQTRTMRPLLHSRFDESGATLSPDGGLIAYVSNESGQNEVYVQPFPALDRRVQVSSGGGTEPAWSRDGRTLFFRLGNALLGATVESGSRLTAGRPVQLFEGTFASTTAAGLAAYDVSADGRRFVMVERSTLDEAHSGVEVVVNFFGELRRQRPAGNGR